MSQEYSISQTVGTTGEECRTDFNRVCSVQGCGKKHEAKGFCQNHYKRQKKYGSPLAGRTPPGDLLKFAHEVVVPYAGDECIRWPYSLTGAGYGQIFVSGKNVVAARYICQVAHGLPPTTCHEAAHSCGNGHLACVTPNHLRWATRKENCADMVKHGTKRVGELNGNSKLTEYQAREILRQKGAVTQVLIAGSLGVTRAAVSDIHCGRSWAWIRSTPGGRV